MTQLPEKTVHCPYCGESINILIDASVPQQDYIEDCQVCCSPICMDVVIHEDGDISVTVKHQNE